MAAALLEVGLSNLVVAAVLAAVAVAAGKWGGRPAVTHALWLLVMLKLVTPPVISVPVPVLPPAPQPAPVAPRLPEPPRPPAAEPPAAPPAQSPDAAPGLYAAGPKPRPNFEPLQRNFNELRPGEDGKLPVKILNNKAGEKDAAKSAPAQAAPNLPLIPVEPMPNPGTAGMNPAARQELTQATAAPGEPSSSVPDSSTPVADAPGPPAPAREPSPAGFVVAVWLGGAAAWLALVAYRVRRFGRVLRMADDAPPWFAREVADTARTVGLARLPRVKVLPGTVAPMVWSLGGTAVYFPADLLARLDPAQRASLVAHELAHLKRRDHLVRWLELVVLALYWWCPLVWLARRELQRAEEECCDAWVVATLPTAGRTYAAALLDTLDFLAGSEPAPAMASGMGAAATVKRRLLLILDGRTPNRMPRTARVSLALLALLLLPVAPKLARLAAKPDGEWVVVPLGEPLARKGQPQPPAATAPPKKDAPATRPTATNPRGEPLMFEPNSAEVRVRGQRLWAVAVSPDGKTIVTSQGMRGFKTELLVWDRESGQVRLAVPYPDGVRSVAFSPDGNVFATACYDGIVRFHDAETMKVRGRTDPSGGGTAGRARGVNGLSFFKGGKYLATAGLQANVVNVWDVEAILAKGDDETAKCPPVAVLQGHEQRVLSVAATADGKTIISGGGDQTARLWDLPESLPKMGDPPLTVQQARAVLRGHQSEVEAVAASPDGTLFATGSWDAQVFTWDRDGKRLTIAGGFRNPVLCVTFSKDGKYLAAGAGPMGGTPGQPGDVRVWDVAERKELAYRTDYPEAVFGVAFTPDNKHVVSVGEDRALHLWPFADPKQRQTFRPGGLVYEAQPLASIAASPDGQLLAFAGDAKGIFIWSRAASKLFGELTGHGDVVTGLAFSPDGKTLASASHDKTVKLWDTETWKERQTLAGHTGWVFGLAFSPDGKTLATGSYDKTVRLWDVATGGPKGVWRDHTAGVRSVAISPDGKFLASAGSDRVVRVWDAAEGKVVHQLKGHKGAIRSVAFSPDGKTLASGSEDRTVKFWEAATGKELRTFGGLPDMVTAVRFSPKGQTLVVGTFQGSVVVLDPLTGRKRQDLNGHGDAATGAVFVEDGKSVVTVSLDRTIRQWKAVAPTSVAAAQTLGLPPALYSAVAVNPEGTAAVLARMDGSVVLWDFKTGDAEPVPHAIHPDGVAQLAAGPDLRIASVGKDNKVVVGRFTADLVWKADGRFACFSPDGKHVAVVSGRDVVLYESDSGKEVRKFAAGHDGPVQCATFSADGKFLATAGEDTRVRLWDAATAEKKQLSPPLMNYTRVPWMGFNADGTALAVAANAPDMPPVDDMTGQFQVIRSVYVFQLPGGPGAANALATPNNNQPPPFLQQHPLNLEVTGAAWTRDGRGLITTSADGVIRLWDAKDPQSLGRPPVQMFRGHDASIAAAAVSAETGAFVTAGEDMAVKRWRMPGADQPIGMVRLTPPGLGRVWASLYSPDGKYFVAAGGGDRAFRVYNSPPVSAPVEPDKFGSVFGLAFSPDGKFLVTGHEKGVVVVRDAATGKPVRTLEGHKKRVASIAFAENGAALVTVGGNREVGKEPGEAFVWDFAAGTVRHKLDAPAYQWMVATHPDGKTAAVAAADGKVRVFDVGSGKVVTSFGKAGVVQKSVAFSPDGAKLVASGNDQAVRVYDVANGAELRRIPVPPMMLTDARFSPDGSEVVVAAWKGTPPNDRPPVIAAYRLDDASAQPRQFPVPPPSVQGLAFLPDGKTLVAACGVEGATGTLRFYDFATTKLLGEFRGHRNWAQGLAVSADGKRIASTGWGTPTNGELRLWDLGGGMQPLATVAVPGENQYSSSGAISPDGKTLVLGGWGQTLTVWDMTDPAKPALKKQLKDHKAGLRSVDFDAEGTRFVTSDEGGMVKVWDAATLARVASWKASANGVYRAKFTPDGTGVVTCSGNWQARVPSELRVWDPATGKETGRFPDQTREVWDIAFLDGGKLMVTSGTISNGPDDAHLKVWDFATKQVVRTPVPNGALNGARPLAVSADGKYLAVGSNTGQVKVFETASWQEVLDVPGLKDVSFALAFSPDGSSLAVASGDNAAIVIRLPWAK